MTIYNVTLVNETRRINTTIPVSENQYIFDAAQEQGHKLPMLCLVGTCSSCTGRILSGEVDQSDQCYLDDDEISDGFVLLCVAYPVSNCTILTHQENNL